MNTQNKKAISGFVAISVALGSFVFWTELVSTVTEDTAIPTATITPEIAEETEEVAVQHIVIENLSDHYADETIKTTVTPSVVSDYEFASEPVHAAANEPPVPEVDTELETNTVGAPEPVVVPTNVVDLEPTENDEGALQQWELAQAWSLSIPSIGVRSPVMLPSGKYWNTQKWDLLEEQMQVGLNHGAVAYPHSVTPGNTGSLIIAGHSSPPDELAAQSKYGHLFSRLPEVEPGETISVLTTAGPVEYVISHKYVVSPEQTSILAQQYDDSTLKLITCYPVGTTRDRMIVVAKKVGEQ